MRIRIYLSWCMALLVILCTIAVLSVPVHAVNSVPIPTYAAYLKSFPQAGKPDASILISGGSFLPKQKPEHISVESYTAKNTSDSRSNVLICACDAFAGTCEIAVPKTGYYALELTYCPIATADSAGFSAIRFALKLDGNIPYDRAERFVLNRIFERQEPVSYDAQGNERRVPLVQAECWQKTLLSDPDGLQAQPMQFYLEQGRHTVTLDIAQAWIALESLRFCNVSESVYEPPTAADLQMDAPVLLRMEGEDATYQSDVALCPTYDRTSSGISPSDPNHLRYNTIGGGGIWNQSGQAITWECTVPEDGWYKIGIKARQNVLRGFHTSRRIYVDGTVPCPELEQVNIPYDTAFQVIVPEDETGTPIYIYLTGNTVHTLTLEAIPNEIGQAVQQLEEITAQVNTCYRQIVMITGPEPDLYTDYYVHEKLPELPEQLADAAKQLRAVQRELEQQMNASGTEAAALDGLAMTLEVCAEEPLRIPEYLTRMKEDIAAVAAWMCDCRKQPLEVDYIELADASTAFSEPDAGFWSELWYSIQRFFASFRSDADTLATNPDADALTVWVALGRDQTQVVQTLTESQFVPETGIPVSVQLVSGGITEAVLADAQPDVALYLGGDYPVNLACRGLLTDLTAFPDFSETAAICPAEAYVPYQYDGGTYAMPLTRNWAMLFYRKDVLTELGLSKPPETWDALKTMLPVLQRKHLSAGLVLPQISNGSGTSQLSAVPPSGHTFAAMLLQSGSTYYNPEQTAVLLDTPEAVDAFKQWTDFYTKYGFEQQYDAFSRFRTGAYPLVIAEDTFYNQLEAAAPELQGLWGMTAIPGTVQPDGTVSHAETSNGTGAVIFRNADASTEQAAWKYLQWFCSEDVQAQAATQMEGISGIMGRYASAEPNVRKRLSYSAEDMECLLDAADELQEIPILPASYATERSLMNAFRAVVNERENPRDTLLWCNRDIQQELTRKRKHLGLDADTEQEETP